MEPRVARFVAFVAGAILLTAAPLVACGRSEAGAEPPPSEQPPAPENGQADIDGGYAPIELDDERVERSVAYLDDEVLEQGRVDTVLEAYVQVVAGYRVKVLARVATEGEARLVEAVVYLPIEGPPELVEIVRP